MEGKRLIEVDFPLKEVSEESVKEKNIKHGHISTIHIWWARRPLAASRATTYAALIPAPKNYDELRKKLEFIHELSKWENSLNQRLIENAKREIKEQLGGTAPKVLDCFAGEGAIPLEALRLDCKTFALEYNPVAVLILKSILEYPQKYGKKRLNVEGGLNSVENPLVEDFQKWSKILLEETKKEIGKFYPPEEDGCTTPISYLWARTIKCKDPSCRAEIPLLRQFWLANMGNKRIALKMIVDKNNKRIDFKIVKDKEIDFDPSQGTTIKGTALCPVCGAGIDAKTIMKEVKEGRMDQRLIAVVLDKGPYKKGKNYRIATEKDVRIFKEAEEALNSKIKKWDGDLSLIPDELLPTPDRGQGAEENRLYFNFAPVVLYGMKTWGDLFNSRQKLVLVTFVEKLRRAYKQILEETNDVEYAKAIVTYLAMAVDALAHYSCMMSIWLFEHTISVFIQGQALPMRRDYAEANPFGGLVGSWDYAVAQIAEVISNCAFTDNFASVRQGTATRLPYETAFFDAVITDPPYYNNCPYSDLSDFFYVWLKRMIGDVYPEYFSTPLTPKSDEIIEDLSLLRGAPKKKIQKEDKIPTKTKEFFEEMITKSFKEVYRVLKPEGIAVIVFAYKSTEAWETIINSLLKSGLVLTASWPIHTERKGRLRAHKSATLASSVYMICRKRTKEKIAYFNEIRAEIDRRIKEKLAQFWEQGISGADFFVSAIGPAVEVFGKYSKVEKLSGEEVYVKELLEYVRKVVSEFALERVLKRADLGGVDAETRFYLLWRWTFGNAKVHFDDAIKLSRPMGVELTQLWDGGSFIKKEKEFIRVPAPQERAKDPSFMKKTKFTSIIDVLHYAVVLWERGEREKIKDILNETGYAGNEIFWQTAQAISEVLPQGDKEKQLLQGFLYGKEVYVKEARGKTSLLDYMESE